MRKFLLILVIVLLAITSLQLWMTKDRTEQKKALEQQADQGEAAIGGDFALTDQNGKTVHASDFRGRLMLVFFGYTHCPDICPVTVATLSKTLGLLGAKADQVVPIFITVDPKRDTPEVLKDFLANFDKRLVGLTGTPEEIKQVAEAYKTYFSAQSTPQNTPEDMHGMEHDDNYSVDHSAFIYLMGRDGKYIRLFQYNDDAQTIARGLEKHL